MAGLSQACGLSAGAAASLRELVGPLERYPTSAVLSSIAPVARMKWIISGWVCEHRVLPDGRRQIFSFGLPGDVVLSRPALGANPCSVVALTSVVCVDVAQILAAAREPERAELWRAMNLALVRLEERRYDQVMRLGRHTAIERVASLLLELYERLAQIGQVEDEVFHLPLTQEQLADALGLSAVHVNRSLKALRLGEMATLRFGRVSGFNPVRLAAMCRV